MTNSRSSQIRSRRLVHLSLREPHVRFHFFRLSDVQWTALVLSIALLVGLFFYVCE
jgi:hypothetical protein